MIQYKDLNKYMHITKKQTLTTIIIGFIIAGIYLLNPKFENLQGSLQNNTPQSKNQIEKLSSAQSKKINKLSIKEFTKFLNQTENKYSVFNNLALYDLISQKTQIIYHQDPDIQTPSIVLVFESQNPLQTILSQLKNPKLDIQNTAWKSFNLIDFIQIKQPNSSNLSFQNYKSTYPHLFAIQIEKNNDLMPSEFTSLLINKVHNLNKAASYFDLAKNSPKDFKEQSNIHKNLLSNLLTSKKTNLKFLINGIYNSENIKDLKQDLSQYPQIFKKNNLSPYKQYLFLNNLSRLKSQFDLQKMYLTKQYFQTGLSVLDQTLITFKLNSNFSNLRKKILFQQKELTSFDPSFAHLLANSNVQLFQSPVNNKIENTTQLVTKKQGNIDLSHLCQESKLLKNCDQLMNIQVKKAEYSKDTNLQIKLPNFQGFYINSNSDLTELLNIYTLQNKRIQAMKVTQDPLFHIQDIQKLNDAFSNLQLKIVRQIDSNSAFDINQYTGEKLIKTIHSCQILGSKTCTTNSKANFHYLIGTQNDQLQIIEVSPKSETNLLSLLIPSAQAFNPEEPPAPEDLIEEDIEVPALELEEILEVPALEELINIEEILEVPALEEDIEVPALLEEAINDRDNPIVPFIRIQPRVIQVPFISPLEELLEPPFISRNRNVFPAPPFIRPLIIENQNLLIPPFIGNILFGRNLEAQVPFIQNADGIFEGDIDLNNDENNNDNNDENNNDNNQNNNDEIANNRGGGGGGGGRRGSGSIPQTETEEAYQPCTINLPYLDISADDPNFYKYVWAYCANIFTGKIMEDGSRKLDPNANFNRAEFTKIGVMLSQSQLLVSDRSKNLYKDVPKDSQEWYYDFLYTATNNKFVSGYKDELNFGKFLPENTISFAETLSIALKTSIQPELVGNTKKDPWHQDIISNYKKINGVGKLTPPNTPLTRKQAILVIYDLWSKGLYGEKFM